MMQHPVTVNELYEQCKKLIDKNKGDMVIMLSDDDEGNGYHYCWYTFTKIDKYTEEYVDKDIAPKNKTIILG